MYRYCYGLFHRGLLIDLLLMGGWSHFLVVVVLAWIHSLLRCGSCGGLIIII
jgi:hypothetical protein